MKVFEAKEITGGLSKPSKMPGFSYNLPAYKCITGVKLQAVPGSVCAGCYAMKGRYAFSNTKKAMNRRLASLTHPKWGLAMSVQINSKFKYGHDFFRWHDSGDLQSLEHLRNIFDVCLATPAVGHWMPTREVNSQDGSYVPLRYRHSYHPSFTSTDLGFHVEEDNRLRDKFRK